MKGFIEVLNKETNNLVLINVSEIFSVVSANGSAGSAHIYFKNDTELVCVNSYASVYNQLFDAMEVR